MLPGVLRDCSSTVELKRTEKRVSSESEAVQNICSFERIVCEWYTTLYIFGSLCPLTTGTGPGHTMGSCTWWLANNDTHVCSDPSDIIRLLLQVGLTVREGRSQSPRRHSTFHANCGTRAHHWEKGTFVPHGNTMASPFKRCCTVPLAVMLTWHVNAAQREQEEHVFVVCCKRLCRFFFFLIDATLKFIFQASACRSVRALTLRGHR